MLDFKIKILKKIINICNQKLDILVNEKNVEGWNYNEYR